MKYPAIRFKDPRGADFPVWVQSNVGSLCKLYQSTTLSKRSLDNSGPYAVYGANGIIGRHSEFNHEKSEVVVSCRGDCGSIHLTRPFSWINGNAMVVHSKDESILNKIFLSYLLLVQDFKPIITGGAQPQITRSDLSSLRISFPCLQEQQRIAEFFSMLDEKIAASESRLEILERLREGLVQNIFRKNSNYRQGLSSRSCEWGIAKLGDVAEIKGRIGFRGYSRSDISDKDNGVISLSPGNIDRGRVCIEKGTYISREKFEESPEIKVGCGDILFTKTGSTVGKVGMFRELCLEATINPQIAIIKATNVNSCYLMNYLLSYDAKQYISSITVGGALPIISQKELSKMLVPVPSREEQEKIASLFFEVDKKIELSLEKITVLEKLKQGLLKQMFI